MIIVCVSAAGCTLLVLYQDLDQMVLRATSHVLYVAAVQC